MPATIDQLQLEQFITESFSEGVSRRELRLSSLEVKFLRERYPHSSFKELALNDYQDGKTWFEVQLG